MPVFKVVMENIIEFTVAADSQEDVEEACGNDCYSIARDFDNGDWEFDCYPIRTKEDSADCGVLGGDIVDFSEYKQKKDEMNEEAEEASRKRHEELGYPQNLPLEPDPETLQLPFTKKIRS